MAQKHDFEKRCDDLKTIFCPYFNDSIPEKYKEAMMTIIFLEAYDYEDWSECIKLLYDFLPNRKDFVLWCMSNLDRNMVWNTLTPDEKSKTEIMSLLLGARE